MPIRLKIGFAAIGIAFLTFLSPRPVRAQMKYNGQIEPGVSTRRDVDAALGAPIKQESTALFDYQPPAGAKTLAVEYRADGVVNRLQAQFTQPYSRDAIRQALGLPNTSETATAAKGFLTELFGAPAYMVFGYASADVSSGVSVIMYCSPDAFQTMLAAAEKSKAASSGGTQPTPAPAPVAPGPQPEAQNSGPLTPISSNVAHIFIVKLLTTISSTDSKSGDTIRGQVISPDTAAGSTVTGTVRSIGCTSAGVLKCVLDFSIDTMTYKGQTIPVVASMFKMLNSMGQPHVDEEGDVITQGGNWGTAILNPQVAASINHTALGPHPPVYIELSANGQTLSFWVGSQFSMGMNSDWGAGTNSQ